MNSRVFVTGCGMISSIGDNFKEMADSVCIGKTGLSRITFLETYHKDRLNAGEVKHNDIELANMSSIELEEGITRTVLLGLIAAKEAIRSAEISDSTSLNLITGTTVGGMVSTEKYYMDFLMNDSRNAFINSHDCGDIAERMALLLGITGYLATINTACSSSANAIMLGAKMINTGRAKRVLAGGVDALSKFTLNGFNTLMIADPEQCKPFDDNRNGLNLGEGAGYLLLESEDTIGDRNPLCEITGWGNANDAFHQTASSPDGRGPYLSMKAALEQSKLMRTQLNYINAHGTATQNNDLSEGMAIERLFTSDIPFVSSTKSMTGHLLGASGAIEAGISIISLMHDIIPPNLNFKTKMKELHFAPSSVPLHYPGLRHVMSNSFGFGGNNTSLIFSKC